MNQPVQMRTATAAREDSTTSNVFVDLVPTPAHVFSLEQAGTITALFIAECRVSAQGQQVQAQITVDNNAANPGPAVLTSDTMYSTHSHLAFRTSVPAGQHTVTVQWRVTGGTGFVRNRSFTVWELDSPQAAGAVRPLAAERLLDTRSGIGGPTGKVAAQDSRTIQLTGQGGIPGSGVAAALLTVTAVEPAANGFLTVFPAGSARPPFSSLSFGTGHNSSSLILARPGTNGQVTIFNGAPGPTHLVADVAGWVAS